MNKTCHKLKNWYRGKNIPYTLQEMMDLQRRIYPDAHYQKLPERFDPPLIARIISSIGRFLISHWKILLPIIVGAIIALFIHFDSKSSGEPQQKHDKTPQKTNIRR